MSGRSRGCGAIRRSIPPHGTSGFPRQPLATLRSPFDRLPGGAHPGPRRSHAMAPPAPACPPGVRWARPAPHRGQSPISSAATASHTAVPILCHPRLSRGDVTSQPAGPHNAAGTPHGVRPGGLRGTRLTPAAIATAPSARRLRRCSGSRPATLHGCRGPLSPWCVPCPTPAPPSSGPTSGPS